MLAAALPANEKERLAALRALGVLDTPPEAALDAIVRAAAAVCGTPISLISLVDEHRQWFKANVGLEGVSETPREVAFCSHALLGSELMLVEDATQDERFADNPLVTGRPDIRFYAGMPLSLSSGQCLGTLCVIDRVPRRLDDSQRVALEALAEAAALIMEGRQRDRATLTEATAEMAKLSQVARFTSHAVIIADAEGRATWVNEGFTEISGYAPEEILGRKPGALLQGPDTDPATVAAISAALRRREGCRVEILNVGKSGRRYWLDLEIRPLLDERGALQGFVAIESDITARKDQEIALRLGRDLIEADRRRLASLIEGTGAGTWEWNVQTGELRLNERWAAIVGYQLADLEPISISTLLALAHPDDLARSNAALEAHFAGNSAVYEVEARIRHRDGRWVWVQDRGRVVTFTEDGKPEWMYGTHIDITRRREREEALQRSEAMLARTGELASVGGWELNLESGEPVWSDETCRIHGVPPGYKPRLDEAIAFYAPEARPVIEAAVAHGMASGEGWDLELPFIRADGERIWVRALGRAEFENDKPVRLVGAFQDVTERRKLQAALAEQADLLRTTMASIGDAVITVDTDGKITWINPAAERLLGWLASQVVGQVIHSVLWMIDDETRSRVSIPIADCQRQDTPMALGSGALLVRSSGEEVAVEASVSPIRGTGRALGAVLVLRDVSERRRLDSEMRYRATHDGLTGLFNRVEFGARLARAVTTAQEERSRHALVFIDLDHFKLVNDTCGHAAGDLLLQQIAQLISDVVRQRDVVARLGGDEFALLLEHCPLDQARRIAEKLCERVDDYRFAHGDQRFRVGTSIGIAPVTSDTVSASEVMNLADEACRAAKAAGRNRVHVAEAGMARGEEAEEGRWFERIERALDENALSLFGQPVIEMDSGQPAAIEVLVRLPGEQGDWIDASRFVPLIERFGLAPRLDRWVVDAAVGALRGATSWPPDRFLAINLTKASLGDHQFHRWLEQLLDGLGPVLSSRLCFDVPESAVQAFAIDVSRFLATVRAGGAKVALDDFGGGIVTFGQLRGMTFDFFKLDGHLVRGAGADPLDAIVLRGLVDAARVLGAQVIAEGVENEGALRVVREHAIAFAQGDQLAAPAPLHSWLGATKPKVPSGWVKASL